MSLLASIDIGSNTLRLLIGRVENHKLIDVFSDRRITRLGNEVAQTGMLQEENMTSSLRALREFSSAIAKYGAGRVKAVATSALREASNSDVFIKKVFDETSILIEVISGKQEAELTLKGVLSSLRMAGKKRPPLSPPLRGGDSRGVTLRPKEDSGGVFIVDIGGGSSEWILYRGKDHFDMGSIPIGVIKLARNFISTDPVSEADMNKLNLAIRPVLEYLGAKIGHLTTKHTRFIGTAGTFTAVASIDLGLDAYSREKIHLHTISLSRLHALGRELTALTLAERKKIAGLEPERADLIIPGIQFTIKIMEFFGFGELIISDYGLLEGAILDLEKDISEAGKP